MSYMCICMMHMSTHTFRYIFLMLYISVYTSVYRHFYIHAYVYKPTYVHTCVCIYPSLALYIHQRCLIPLFECNNSCPFFAFTCVFPYFLYNKEKKKWSTRTYLLNFLQNDGWIDFWINLTKLFRKSCMGFLSCFFHICCFTFCRTMTRNYLAWHENL